MTELPEAVRTLLDGPNYAHIATLLPDGAPHSVPVWIGLEDNRIAFLTGPGSRKARNLDRDPRVAISITAHDNPFTMTMIRGRVAQMIDGDEAWTIIDRISYKYTGKPYPLRTGRVVFLIDHEHAQAHTFG
ncbi:MAG TPA: PPOX class F420-dependent oxidoreductase [Streptosporangiaceae bacterium]|nr:PPOX class F420-dependent oxidoreductase [Streptosporangiaceae bacterium]